MLLTESTEPSATTFNSVSPAQIKDSSFRPSMLYNVLPTMVSSRLPTIPSLRQSLGDVRSRAYYNKSDTVIELPQPVTPPPGYSTMPPSETVSPHKLFAALGEAEVDFADDVSEGQASSRAMPLVVPGAQETRSGVRWRYAGLGISLLQQASRESNASSGGLDEASATLIRQLYIHGITYLLRGLPENLTPDERLSLQAALPQVLVESVSDSNTGALVRATPQSSDPAQRPPQNPTIIHRITAAFVLQTFLFLQFLLPYIRLFLSHAYRFEKKHRVTQRIINTSVATADELGQKALRFSQVVCQMNDGMVIQTFNDLTMWWITGVTGGVQQGLAEGPRTMKAVEGQRRGEVEEEK